MEVFLAKPWMEKEGSPFFVGADLEEALPDPVFVGLEVLLALPPCSSLALFLERDLFLGASVSGAFDCPSLAIVGMSNWKPLAMSWEMRCSIRFASVSSVRVGSVAIEALEPTEFCSLNC